jgi:hypothetical protein
MTLVGDLLGASALGTVRALVRDRTADELRGAIEPLAEEVLRLMRSDAARAMSVSERADIVAGAVGDPVVRARAEWVSGQSLDGALRNNDSVGS